MRSNLINSQEKKALVAVLLFLGTLFLLISLTETYLTFSACCLNPDSPYLCEDVSVDSCCDTDLACQNNDYTVDSCDSLPDCTEVCCCIYEGSSVRSSYVTLNISCPGDSYPLRDKSCSDICQDNRPLPISAKCTLNSPSPSNPMSDLQIEFDYTWYPRKIILNWNDACNEELISYKIYRVDTDTESTIYEPLDVVFEPYYEDTTFNFSKKYKYIINATYTTGHTFQIMSDTVNTGDIECWLAPKGEFCIDASYYLKYMGYFGYTDQTSFLLDLLGDESFATYKNRINNGYYCDGNTLRIKAACSDDEFCVKTSEGVTCSEGQECISYNYDLGINPDKEKCNSASGCYFDEGAGLTGLCLSCEAPYLMKFCYSYKSRYACEQDKCNFALSDKGCEWIGINDDLGLGFCIDPSNINCADCNSYLEESPYTTCEDLYASDPRFSGCAICGLISSCTNYTSEELCVGQEGAPGASIDLSTHAITPSNDFCGLGACDYLEGFGCVKNIDLYPENRDCTAAGSLDECEGDVYPPKVNLVKSFDANNLTLKDSLKFAISDKTDRFGGSVLLMPDQELPSGYVIYLCSGSNCYSDHLSWKEFHSTTISACDLYDILDFKDNSSQTLKYFVKDPAGNVGLVNSIVLKTDPDRVCTPGDTHLCPNQNGVCKNSRQTCVEVCPEKHVGYYDHDCTPEEYNITGKYEFIEESVDGLDNDCDGLIDEGSEKEFLCNGLDDDNDGLIDEGWPDFDGDNTEDLCDYSNYDSQIINGQTYHYFKIKSGLKLSELNLGYRYDAKYCGADCVDLDADNDGVIDRTFTGEIIDKDNNTIVGCEVYMIDDSRKGISKDLDNDGVCDGLDKCATPNPDCEVYSYSNKELSGCPKDCRDADCLGDPYCQELCECDFCSDFYGVTCDYSKCTLGCGCYYEVSSGSCLDCSTVDSCESYGDAQSCRSNSCKLLTNCEWDDSKRECYTDSDGDGLPDSEDPCPFDLQNDYDNDGFCENAANEDLIGKEIIISGRTFILKGSFDCNDRDKDVYPRPDYDESSNSECDNLDNDCDGLIDENCDCVTGDFRDCGNLFFDYSEFSVCKKGIQRCIDGSWSDTCFDFVGPEVENEAKGNKEGLYCDGKDNDCNGVVDEGCVCLPDETVPCGTDLGICKVGYRKCGADFTFEDICFEAIEPEEEICGDYLDNDCDGSIDEGCPCVEGQTMPCPDSTPFVFSLEGSSKYVSACKLGEQRCISGVWTTCIGFNGPEVLEESSEIDSALCDSKDNDCDGLVDETCSCFTDKDCRTNCGWGIQKCEYGTLSEVCEGAIQPSEEKKGDGDEDCDGLVDEGFPEDTCDGIDEDNDGWVDDGFPDFDGDNDPRICDFSTPITMDEKVHFKTKDGLFWCGADCIDLDKDNDGLTNDIDKEPVTPLGCKVDKSNGVALDSDNDRICDGLDMCEESLPDCPVYSYGEEFPGCPKNCAHSNCLDSSFCKCPSCDACESTFYMPDGCDSLHCSYCGFGTCALSYAEGSTFCNTCDSKESCDDYINELDCENNPCLSNTFCVWNGSSCLTDSDGDGLSDIDDPCPQDVGNDNDGDGFCENVANPRFITSDSLFGGMDCNDDDPTIHIGCGCILDFDGDGYGDGCDWGMDCNDRDPTRNTFCENGCRKDMDGDGYGLGCNAGPDCDDYDPSLTTQCTSADLCFDGLLDGKETDVDCGGGECNPCNVGKQCIVDSDCKSGKCNHNLCYDKELCNNGIKDDFEVDVDCGGPCDPCEDGKSCTKDSHCESNNCVMGTCRKPTCNDNKKNQDETDVDCGGHLCAPCEIGKHCKSNKDCLSGNCDFDTFTCKPQESSEDKDLDTDEDGIPDSFEEKYGLNLEDKNDAHLDLDNDGLSNLEEYKLSQKYLLDLNPVNPDTDGDGIPDGEEIKKGTNPVVPDKKSHLGLVLGLIVLSALITVGYLYRDKIKQFLDKYRIVDKILSFLNKYGVVDFVYRRILRKEPPVYQVIRKTKAPKVTETSPKTQKPENIATKPGVQNKSFEQISKIKRPRKLDKKLKETSKIFDAFESTDSSRKDKNNEDIFKEFEK